MNYNYLRYFSVLAQVEHYTVAAARLGISQPSLSNAINHLENELGGIRLFEKVGRNIRLTEEGRYFQEKVDVALQELNSASVTLRNSRVAPRWWCGWVWCPARCREPWRRSWYPTWRRTSGSACG